MRAYAHLLLTAAAFRALRRHTPLAPDPAFVAGALLPDVPLALLSAGFLAEGRLRGRREEYTLCSAEYNRRYFENPAWIAAHNAFHAPLLQLAAGLAGDAAARQGKAWGGPLVWLAAGCGLHTAIDFATHIDDGPLPLFPFNWRRRVRGLLSYWDSDHGGDRFRRLEALLALLAGLYLLLSLPRRGR